MTFREGGHGSHSGPIVVDLEGNHPEPVCIHPCPPGVGGGVRTGCTRKAEKISGVP